MGNVGVFSFGRVKSERCPNKMLRPFAETTLTDIVLSKLEPLRDAGYMTFFAGLEDEFRDKCEDHRIQFVRRDEKSAVIDGPLTGILSFLREVDSEYFLIVSACGPFLKAETIRAFLDECTSNGYESAISVMARKTFFIDLDRSPLNFEVSSNSLNTKTVRPVYEIAHQLYFFNRNYFFENGMYWDWANVNFVELETGLETLDIDTEEDFWMAEQLWKARQLENASIVS
jgi:spore coat polysaccharide biosynthesis protein SpsF (cytidylyltransferase family)